MTSHASLLIHIGHAKAASTWLQTHLLGNQVFGFQMPFDKRCVRMQLAVAPPFEFSAQTCREYFHPTLESLDRTLGFPALSCEALTGSSRIGDFQRMAIADRLADVFPHAKIFFVLREQRSMQVAQYHQYLRRGGVYSLNKFLRPPMSDRKKVPYFDWNRFQYHHLLGYYHRLFGGENVLALPLEMLHRKPECFLRRLAEFCGIQVDDDVMSALPVNDRTRPSQSTLIMGLRRPLNFLVGERTSFNPRSILPLRRTKQRFKRWGDVIDNRLPQFLKSWHRERVETIVSTCLADYYAESNRKVSDLIGIDLAEYGYEVAAPNQIASEYEVQARSSSLDAA